MNYELRIKEKIPIIQPEKLDTAFVSTLNAKPYTMFIVASYGKILPKEILNIPKHGTLNVHPSLLPLFRGPSPIQFQILEGVHEAGVTIILMDEKIDHGPILAQQVLGFKIYDLRFKNFRDELAKLGGKLLAETIPEWVAGNIDPQEQDHKAATFTKQIQKKDGLVDIKTENPEMLYRKFKAFDPWPSIYFLRSDLGAVKGPTLKRIKITDAELKDGKFIIKKVIPEGGRETSYLDFKKKIKSAA